MSIYNTNPTGKSDTLNPDGSFKYLRELMIDGKPYVEVVEGATLKVPPATLDVGNTTSIDDDFGLIGINDKVSNEKYGLPYVYKTNQDGTTGGVFYRKIGEFAWSDPFNGIFSPTDEVSAVLNPVTGLYELEQAIQSGITAVDKFRYWVTEFDGDRTFDNLSGEIINRVYTTDVVGGNNELLVYSDGVIEESEGGFQGGNTYLIDNPIGKDIEIQIPYVFNNNPIRSIWYCDKPFSMKRMSADGGITNIIYLETYNAEVEFKRVITEDDIKPVFTNIQFNSMRRVTSNRGLEIYNGERSYMSGGIDDGAVPYLNEIQGKITKAVFSGRSLAINNNAVPDPIVNFNVELYEIGFNSTTKIADLVFPIDSVLYDIGNNNSTNRDTFVDSILTLDISLNPMKKYGLNFVRINGTGDISAYRDIQIVLRAEETVLIEPVVLGF